MQSSDSIDDSIQKMFDYTENLLLRGEKIYYGPFGDGHNVQEIDNNVGKRKLLSRNYIPVFKGGRIFSDGPIVVLNDMKNFLLPAEVYYFRKEVSGLPDTIGFKETSKTTSPLESCETSRNVYNTNGNGDATNVSSRRMSSLKSRKKIQKQKRQKHNGNSTIFEVSDVRIGKNEKPQSDISSVMMEKNSFEPIEDNVNHVPITPKDDLPIRKKTSETDIKVSSKRNNMCEEVKTVGNKIRGEVVNDIKEDLRMKEKQNRKDLSDTITKEKISENFSCEENSETKSLLDNCVASENEKNNNNNPNETILSSENNRVLVSQERIQDEHGKKHNKNRTALDIEIEKKGNKQLHISSLKMKNNNFDQISDKLNQPLVIPRVVLSNVLPTSGSSKTVKDSVDLVSLTPREVLPIMTKSSKSNKAVSSTKDNIRQKEHKLKNKIEGAVVNSIKDDLQMKEKHPKEDICNSSSIRKTIQKSRNDERVSKNYKKESSVLSEGNNGNVSMRLRDVPRKEYKYPVHCKKIYKSSSIRKTIQKSRSDERVPKIDKKESSELSECNNGNVSMRLRHVPKTDYKETANYTKINNSNVKEIYKSSSIRKRIQKSRSDERVAKIDKKESSELSESSNGNVSMRLRHVPKTDYKETANYTKINNSNVKEIYKSSSIRKTIQKSRSDERVAKIDKKESSELFEGNNGNVSMRLRTDYNETVKYTKVKNSNVKEIYKGSSIRKTIQKSRSDERVSKIDKKGSSELSEGNNGNVSMRLRNVPRTDYNETLKYTKIKNSNMKAYLECVKSNGTRKRQKRCLDEDCCLKPKRLRLSKVTNTTNNTELTIITSPIVTKKRRQRIRK